MADAVSTLVLQNDRTIYKVKLLCLSDGTGESNVVKIDRSTLLAVDNAEPSRLAIAQIQWHMQGFTYLKLSFDHTTDDVVEYLDGHGYIDYSGVGFPGDAAANYNIRGLLLDPNSAGGTGDLLLTSVGPTSGDTYSVTLTCRLIP